jgi:DNA-binding SARP family transcriptional activator
MNTPSEPDRLNMAQWIAQATADYYRLASSLTALGSELAALSKVINVPAATDSPDPHVVVDRLTDSLSWPVITPPRESLLRANLLGRFQLSFAGRKLESELPGQVQTILKYLVSQRKRPVSKDALLDLLWPDTDPSLASGRLRVVMHTLRKHLLEGPLGIREVVGVSGNTYSLNPDINLWVDVEEFEVHWHLGWRLARSGRTEEAIQEYEQAESLYMGDYLEDEPYADWTLLRREALRDAYCTILTMLAQMSLQMADYTGSIIWAQKLLAQDDCREDAYRQLILGHKHLGQPARAAYWYSLCVRTLKRELGLDPSPETQALNATIF